MSTKTMRRPRVALPRVGSLCQQNLANSISSHPCYCNIIRGYASTVPFHDSLVLACHPPGHEKEVIHIMNNGPESRIIKSATMTRPRDSLKYKYRDIFSSSRPSFPLPSILQHSTVYASDTLRDHSPLPSGHIAMFFPHLALRHTTLTRSSHLQPQ